MRSDTARPSHPESAPEVPGYTIDALLYDGANSRVWQGEEHGTGRRVAIRVHRNEYPTRRRLATVRRAFALASDAFGPGLIEHLAVVPWRHDLALVTADHGAVSLHQLVADEGTPPLARTLRIGAAIATAVGRLHDLGVVHKDLNPAHILVHPATDQVWLTDLDIASRLAAEQTRSRSATYAEGSLLYLAPEQTGRVNRPVDSRADLYSLGVTLYELLTGELPFLSKDPMELVHAHIARVPIAPHEVHAAIPRVVSGIVMRLLAKGAEDRYSSAHGLARDLLHCQESLAGDGEIEAIELCRDDVPTRFRIPVRLYGRERESALLLDAFSRAAVGSRELVLVAGYSGIGKSMLVRESQRPVAERGGYFCAGKFDPFRRDLPYLALILAIQDLVLQVLTEPEERLAAHRERVLAALGPNGAVITELVPELNLLIGTQSPVPALAPGESRDRFRSVLRAFVNAFTREDAPLVLFIDDLQWADLPSLNLLSALLTDQSAANLLVIGAYRDNEVGPGHPLLATLRVLADANERVASIMLEPLDEGTVARLVADTVHASVDGSMELTRRVMAKTRGNPFFVRQFLERLAGKGLIRFDAETRTWTWDAEGIDREQITENVADLMSHRVKELPPATKQVLELASCVGASFDLATVAAVLDRPRSQTAREFGPALLEGLIQPQGDDYKYAEEEAALGEASEESGPAVNPRYRFLHDRVQQAAHDGIEPDARRELHLRIGRMLLERTPPDDLEEHVIDIVNHLDEALPLIHDSAERLQLAELNLRAGRRAKSSMAIDPAARYLQVGIELLPDDAWEAQYELARDLHVMALEIAYVGDRIETVAEAETRVRPLLARLSDPLDRLPVHLVRIGVGAGRREYVDATLYGVEVLRTEFGLRLPRNPKTPHILAGLARTKVAMGRRRVPDLIDLPEMTDPHIRAAMGVLMKTVTNAYWGIPNLVPLIAFMMVRLSIRYGMIGLAGYGYALMGMILSAGIGDLKNGYAFGKLALEVLDRTGASELEGKTGLLVHGFIRPSYEPLRICAPDILASYHPAVDAGDLENAAYCGTVAYYADMLVGRPLDWVEERYRDYIPPMLSSGQEHTKLALRLWMQAFDNLRDAERIDTRLTGEHVDFHGQMEQMIRDEPQAQGLAIGVAAAGWLAFVLGDDVLAVRMLSLLAEREEIVPGQPFLLPGLAAYAVVLARRQRRDAASGADRRILRRLTRKLRRRARSNPTDYTVWVALIDAETAWSEDRPDAAVARFEDAAALARDTQNLYLESIAFERGATLHGELGHVAVARHHRERARLAARRWGGWALLRQLESSASGTDTLSSTALAVVERGALDSVDFESVLKAARAVSSEIETDRLVDRALEILVENAGAQRGVLLLRREGGGLYVRAQRSNDGTESDAPEALELTLPRSIADYVDRTRRPLLVEDASGHDTFGRDEYVREHGTRSVLCAPLVRQGEHDGVVYLENNLGVGVFIERHLEVVEAIAGQAAISLENARLYDKERRAAEAFSRFVPRPFLQHLQREDIIAVQLGDSVRQRISILFSDLRSFTTLSEGLDVHAVFELLNAYLARMEPPIADAGGFIDKYIGDAVMALFVGASDDALRAGIDMHRALRTFNAEAPSPSGAPLAMGIGIHTGTAMLGTIGSPNRMETTVIGNPVNLAARIEGMTKDYGAPLLVSEAARAGLVRPERFTLREVGRVRVKGKVVPTTVHDVIDARPDEQRETLLATLPRFEGALAAYYDRRFAEARAAFAACAAEAPFDAVPVRFAAFAAQAEEVGVPDDWDGIEIRTSK